MKAILVVDMPENCIDCSCEQNGICLIKSDAVESIDRPSWCPLLPMPMKMRTDEDDIEEDSYCQGWNACIEEIEK